MFLTYHHCLKARNKRVKIKSKPSAADSTDENRFEHVDYKMAAILSRPQIDNKNNTNTHTWFKTLNHIHSLSSMPRTNNYLPSVFL